MQWWTGKYWSSLYHVCRSASLWVSKPITVLVFKLTSFSCARMKIHPLKLEKEWMSGQHQRLWSNLQISWNWLKLWVKNNVCTCHERCTKFHKLKPTSYPFLFCFVCFCCCFFSRGTSGRVGLIAVNVQCLEHRLKWLSAGKWRECALKQLWAQGKVTLYVVDPRGEWSQVFPQIRRTPLLTLSFSGARGSLTLSHTEKGPFV